MKRSTRSPESFCSIGLWPSYQLYAMPKQSLRLDRVLQVGKQIISPPGKSTRCEADSASTAAPCHRAEESSQSNYKSKTGNLTGGFVQLLRWVQCQQDDEGFHSAQPVLTIEWTWVLQPVIFHVCAIMFSAQKALVINIQTVKREIRMLLLDWHEFF